MTVRNVVSQLVVRSGVATVIVMNPLQSHALSELLSAWRRREDARQIGDLRELANARFRLEQTRTNMRSTFDNGR